MLHLISSLVGQPDGTLPEIPLRVERLTLAKRLWRGTAEDGTEFGFELAATLKDGDPFWQTPAARYVVRQHPEPVVEISLAGAAGWKLSVRVSWAGGRERIPGRRIRAPKVQSVLQRSQPWQTAGNCGD